MSISSRIRRWRLERRLRKVTDIYYRNNKEACDRAQIEFDRMVFEALGVNHETNEES